MKSRMRRWVVLGVMSLTSAAYAQKEQWLEYHTSREGRGYRSLELSTNAPQGVALPKLNATPYFTRWTTGFESGGGRWVCFDRTRKSGPYDRAYIDSNGNGRLDDEVAVATTRLDQYSAYFEPAKVVFKGEDGPVTYHIVFRFMKYDSSAARVMASSGGYYGGQVDIGGKKRRLEVYDYNVNGTFNDSASVSGDCDHVMVENNKAGERYLGKLLEVDGAFYKIEVAKDGAYVKLQKAEDVVLGKVRVPESITTLTTYGENGQFTRSPIKGELTLPAGKYRMESWAIDRKDAKGAKWQLMGYGFNGDKSFTVGESQPASLEIGEPIRVSLRAEERNNQIDFNLNFQGRMGESIQIEKGDQRPPGPKLTLASADQTFRVTNTFEFG